MAHRTAAFLAAIFLATGAAAQSIGTKSMLVGGNLEIVEASAGSVHAAAGKITLNAAIGGNARLAAGNIEVGPDATIADDASFAAGHVTMKGTVKGNLHTAAGNVTIDGPVGGDASVAAGSLTLGPNARIGGSLRYRGGRLERDPGAQVAGRIEHTRPRSREITSFKHANTRWIWTAGLMLLAGIFAATLPGPTNRMAAELRTRPWMAPLLGFIALTCIPVAAVLIMVTIIGIPIGLLALLFYAALLLLGYVGLSVVVGGLLLDRFKAEAATRWAWRAGAAVLTMLVIALLGRVPYLGGLVVFMALVIGVGLIVAVALRRRQENRPAPAVA